MLPYTPSLRKLNGVGVGVGGWGKRVAPYVLIMRAVTREMAFEQRQAIDRDGFAGQCGFAFEPGVGVGGAGAAAGEGDVGQIGAALGREAGADQRVVDLGVERGERVARFGAGEQGTAWALVEPTHAIQPKIERARAQRGERGVDILGPVAVDFADEVQREVELFGRLPRPAARPVLHRREAGFA